MRTKFPPRARHGLVAEPDSAGRYQLSSAKAIGLAGRTIRGVPSVGRLWTRVRQGPIIRRSSFRSNPTFYGDSSMFNSKKAARAAGTAILAGTLLIAAGASAQQPKPAPA